MLRAGLAMIRQDPAPAVLAHSYRQLSKITSLGRPEIVTDGCVKEEAGTVVSFLNKNPRKWRYSSTHF